MWSALVTLFIAAFKWTWGGKQQAQGEAQGQAEQALQDQNQEMQNEAKAQAARDGVDDSLSGLHDDPNNAGPASRR